MRAQEVYGQIVIYYNIDVAASQQKLDIIIGWITNNVAEGERAAMLSRVFENFIPTSTNPYPAIADFKKYNVANDAQIDVRASDRYNDLERKSNAYRQFVTSDSACQIALESIGGWLTFCNRSTDENPWMRKNFIKHYLDAVKNKMEVEPKLFRGISDYKPQTIMIGDESKCKLALEDKSSEVINKIINMAQINQY